ncbi:MAG TPA: PqqD family protein [Herpetosiphon sp.]|uniref:Coenzyme PQQ synthesis D n=2 Tax=Herpetosiphon TaxID=64 RepID=A9B191_HERA2|nr:PqqD family protein [Herpetosiphon sp.]ABX07278.1 conserved hypothetical protein [Herpetosiphon aurantiacus DSM 785]HBW51993.1 PqqD family protein [Herpetosiphon sp.]
MNEHAPQRFVRDPAIVTRSIGSETVLVPVRPNTAALNAIFALNETAALVWQALATPQSLAELIDLVCAEYDVEPRAAQADLIPLLESMLEAAVIQEVA